MKNKNELRDLLDRLKGEVKDSSSFMAQLDSDASSAPAYGPARREEAFPDSFESAQRAVEAAAQRPERPERPQASGRYEFQRQERALGPEGANIIWSENKETMLFGMLASLVAILGGILAGLDYVILVGAASFLLFSLVTVLTLLGYYLNFRREDPGNKSLAERVDHLSRRLEALSVKSISSQPGSPPGAGVKDRELEQKVDELRTLVRSLARAIEGDAGESR